MNKFHAANDEVIAAIDRLTTAEGLYKKCGQDDRAKEIVKLKTKLVNFGVAAAMTADLIGEPK